MPRRGNAPAIARGEPCSKCGADEWQRAGKKDSIQCLACARNRIRTLRKDVAWRLWQSARSRATQSGAEFSITVDDVRQVVPPEMICPALGIRLQEGKNHRAIASSPTLDRLNNEWGYVPGNIAVISHAANRAKSTMRAEELERIAAWMRAQGLA